MLSRAVGILAAGGVDFIAKIEKRVVLIAAISKNGPLKCDTVQNHFLRFVSSLNEKCKSGLNFKADESNI